MANISYADSFSDISDEEFYTATQLLESSLQTSTNVADLSFPDEDLTTAEIIALTPTLQNPRADDDDFPDSELSQADMNSLEHLLNLPGTSIKKCDADATVYVLLIRKRHRDFASRCQQRTSRMFAQRSFRKRR